MGLQSRKAKPILSYCVMRSAYCEKQFEFILHSQNNVIRKKPATTENAKQTQFITVEFRTQETEARRKKCKTKPIIM